jgi:hypothetical protein
LKLFKQKKNSTSLLTRIGKILSISDYAHTVESGSISNYSVGSGYAKKLPDPEHWDREERDSFLVPVGEK